MNREQKIFPEIGYEIDDSRMPNSLEIDVWTTIRIKRNDKWYLMRRTKGVKYSRDFCPDLNKGGFIQEQVMEVSQRLLRDAWEYYHFADVSSHPDSTLLNGEKVFILDKYQISEEERLKITYKPWINITPPI